MAELKAVRTKEDILGWKTPFPTNKPWENFRGFVPKKCLGPFEGETGWQYKNRGDILKELCTWRVENGLELRWSEVVTGGQSGTYGTRRYIIAKVSKVKFRLLQIEFATNRNWYVCAVNKKAWKAAKKAAKGEVKSAASGGAKKREVKRDASKATLVPPSTEAKKAKLSSDDDTDNYADYGLVEAAIGGKKWFNHDESPLPPVAPPPVVVFGKPTRLDEDDASVLSDSQSSFERQAPIDETLLQRSQALEQANAKLQEEKARLAEQLDAEKKRAAEEFARLKVKNYQFKSNKDLKTAASLWILDNELAKLKYGEIEDWDVLEVTSFYELFKEAKEFNEDLSRWKTSNCTNMGGMFQGCSAFNCDLSTWNTSNCTNMGGMFQGCSAFNSNISTWKTSNCTSMIWMFVGCSAFNSDLSTWKTSNCTNMYGMFQGCSAFNSDLSTWNTSNCTDMQYMFGDCSAFNSDLSKWKTSNCTDMSWMFADCSAFNSDLSKWNTSNCTNMSSMFMNATSFDSDLSKWDMSKVEDKTGMFNNATAMNASHKPEGVD
jgi:surface protein